jgi:hypothetical protein
VAAGEVDVAPVQCDQLAASQRLLSASVTCRLQRRSLFACLTELLTAHAGSNPIPLLASPQPTERLPEGGVLEGF